MLASGLLRPPSRIARSTGHLQATAAAMNQATRWLELASYGLVTLLGAWLVWVKAIRPEPWMGRTEKIEALVDPQRTPPVVEVR